jgi:hypothetical protein
MDHTTGSDRTPKRLRRRQLVLELLLLAAVIWLAHFVHFHSFGLYEDDYTHISPPLGWGLVDYLNSLKVLVYWPLGRPLGYFLNFSLAFVGGKLDGLGGLYLMDYAIQVVNAALFYFLLMRMNLGRSAWLGAVLFAITPVITTQSFLMHGLGQEYVSLMFVLLAFHLYLSNRNALAHVVSLACLLTYETPYTVFLAAPLLRVPWDRMLPGKLARHVALWLGGLVAVVAVRTAMGEGRVLEAGAGTVGSLGIVYRIVVSGLWGPLVALGTFIGGPAWTISHWRPDLTAVALISLPIFGFALHRTMFGRVSAGTGMPRRPHEKDFDAAPGEPLGSARRQDLERIAGGLALLGTAYLFSFTHFPPTATYGRLTSVHLAATIGVSLLVTYLGSFFIRMFASRGWGTFAIGLISLYLSLLVGYRFLIQRDFAKAWRNEQRFWTAVTERVPDFADGTMIFVLDKDLPSSRFIKSNSWTDPVILSQLYKFPASWKQPPRLFTVTSDWTETIVWDDGHLKWRLPAPWSDRWEVLPDSNVVVLRWKAGDLVRQRGVIEIHGAELHLRPLPSDNLPVWQPGPLYPFLVGS